MPGEQEQHSSRVPEANHDEEARTLPERWNWVEPVIWTERMIAALETGVKGGRWFSLMDKVCAERTLAAAWERVKRNRGAAGVERQSTEAVAAHAGRYLAALEAIRTWVEEQGLTLHPEKTRIVDARERGGFDFLGYHFERGMHWPKRASEQRFRHAIKAKTRRTNGESMAAIIASINPIIRGWYGSYRHGHPTTFRPLDSYVRGRLRSILRKRAGKRGRGRGSDHQRWPNAYFDAHGLFTMTAARKAAGYAR